MKTETIGAILTGNPALISGRDFEALRCAGLVSELPVGSYFLGPLCQSVMARLAGLTSTPIAQPECAHGEDPRHQTALQYSQHLSTAGNSKDQQGLVAAHWADALAAGHSPHEILRAKLNLEVEQVVGTEVVGLKPTDEQVRWLPLLRKAQGALLLADRCSPEDGPALWTISWILSHSPSGIPMRLSELKNQTFALLGTNRVLEERIDLIVNDSFLQVEHDSEGELICSIDFSGRVGVIPTPSRRSLAGIRRLYRGTNFWAWPVERRYSTSADGETAIFPVSLSLAIFLATHAIRNARRDSRKQSDVRFPGAIEVSGVVEVREKNGRVGVFAKDLEAASNSNPHFYISDSGVFGIRCITGLSDLEPLPIRPSSEPADFLFYAAERLGLRTDSWSGSFPLPSNLREQLAMREDGDYYLAEELLTLIQRAETDLANG